MSETIESVAELRALLAGLGARVVALEEEAARRDAEVSEDVLLAISAACAAYLGKRATVKHVHLRRGGVWVTAGRTAVHHSHADIRAIG